MDESRYAFCWVTEFPLFGSTTSTKAVVPDEPSLHRARARRTCDAPRERSRQRARARAYDVVVNGWELGSGSIRIHRADVQERVFRVLGISPEEGRRALRLPARRACGTARRRTAGSRSGLDRICAIAAGATSIRRRHRVSQDDLGPRPDDEGARPTSAPSSSRSSASSPRRKP